MAISPRDVPPPPMPNIGVAKLATKELAKAAARANDAWSQSQMVDALRSIRYWLEMAEASIETKE